MTDPAAFFGALYGIKPKRTKIEVKQPQSWTYDLVYNEFTGSWQVKPF